MKGIKHLLLLFGALALILAGCGTAAEKSSDQNDEEQTENKEEIDTGTNGQGEAEPEIVDEPEDATENAEKPEEESTDQVMRIMEKNIKYLSNGEPKEETAFLKTSENQNYTMYVLPEYELTAEEPSKDILFLKENDSVNMRIELLPTDVDWTATEQNTKDQLATVSETVNLLDGPDFQFENGIGWEASNGEENVMAFLIKDSKSPVKLTIFTAVDSTDHTALLEMGKTIMKN